MSLPVTIRAFKEKDESDVRNLIKLYTDQDILFRHLKLTETDKRLWVNAYLQVAGRGNSGVYVDNRTGKLVGYMINSMWNENAHPDDFDHQFEKFSPQAQALRRFEMFMEDGTVEYVGSENFMVQEISLLLPEYRKRGIFKLGALWTELKAIKNNADAVMTVPGSQVLAGKKMGPLGCYPLKRVYYHEYRDRLTGGTIFAGLKLPAYEYATLIIKILKKSKL